MKRIQLLFICLIFAITTFSQANDHLKFMGIPITGTITQFQTKLSTKGCTYNKALSSSLSSATRAFKGTFLGKKATIFVYYDNKTKIVYRVKTVIEGQSEDIAEQEYSRIKQLLAKKYGEENAITDTKDDKECISFISLKSKSTNMTDTTDLSELANGSIDLFITKDEEIWMRYPYNFNIHIDYNDMVNTQKHENQQLDEI